MFGERPGPKPPEEEDSEVTRFGWEDTEGNIGFSESDRKRLADLERAAAARRDQASERFEETRLGSGPRRELPLDAEPFDPERAKAGLVAAIDAQLAFYGHELRRGEGASVGEETLLYDSETLNRRIQQLTVTKEWIRDGKAADVVADPELMELMQRDFRGPAIRALRKLAEAET